MLHITRRAYRDCHEGGWTVWGRNSWGHPILAAAGGLTWNRRARALMLLPSKEKPWIGVFWSYGKPWNE